MKCILVDDEQKARINLSNMLGLYCKDVEIVADFGDPHAALSYLEANTVDCIFLDIEMPRLDGFGFVESLESINQNIIFVTAYSDYAIKAFRANAVDYLLKPIEISALESAVEKVRVRISQGSQREMQAVYRNSMLNMLESIKGKDNSRITIPQLHGFKIIDTVNIIRVTADGAYSQLVMNGGATELVSKNIGHFEDVLPQTKFIRVHHSQLINLDFLSEFSAIDGGTAIMKDGSKILIAKRRLKEFKDRIEKFYG